MKRVISLILTLVICISVVSFTVPDAAAGTDYCYLNYYWVTPTTTNDIAESQTATFASYNYPVISDNYRSTYSYGYVEAPGSGSMDANYVKNNASFGSSLIINYTQKTSFTVYVYRPGTFYGVCAETRKAYGSVDSTVDYRVSKAPIVVYQTTLNANGGSSSLSKVITVNTPYTVDNKNVLYTSNTCDFPIPTREGYTCVGWSKNPSAQTGVWSITPSTNDTYYAVWSKLPDPPTEPPVTPTVHNHEWTNVPGIPATCTDSGLSNCIKCKDCGEVLKDHEVIPPLGHEYEVDRVVPPTCQKQGYTVYSCWRCSDTKRGDYTGPVDHEYENGSCIYCGSAEPTEPPTEKPTENSTEEPTDPPHICTALIYVPEVPATATENGVRAHYVCDGCGKLYADATGLFEVTPEELIIPALGEQTEPPTEPEPTEPEPTEPEPTEPEPTEPVPTQNDDPDPDDCTHTILDYVPEVPATYESDGTAAHYYCVICGKLFADAYETVEVTEADLVIPRLTPTEPGMYMTGDADGDGDITSVDVTVIQRCCAFIEVNVQPSILLYGDVDKNGLLEIIDATYIQRYLAFIEIPYSIGE